MGPVAIRLILAGWRGAASYGRTGSGVRAEDRGPVRGQQLLEPAGGVGRDADQNVREVADHVDVA